VLNRGHARWAYSGLLKVTGRDRRLLGRIRRDALTIVIVLHSVSPEPLPYSPPLHPRLFEELLRILTRSFQVCRFDTLAHSDPKRPAAVLTFDDGYGDFVEYAMPLLHKHGVSANMNVIPDMVEGRLTWNVRLFDALAAATRSMIGELSVPGFTQRLQSADANAKARYGARLSGNLKLRSLADREAVWTEHIAPWMARVDVRSPTRMMDVAAVREAAKTHEIGVHSYAHESMAHQDEAYFEADLDRCFEYFRTTLGLPLTTYAFPNGSYRQSQVETLQARGIQHILLVEQKAISERKRQVYPRISVDAMTRWELGLQVLGHRSRGVA
jgi:peptidoglycan/xylan/chitin deacetylase (PgdA/CDA1 family)